MSAERWQRLADDLGAAGVRVEVDGRPYQEMRYGRPVHGVSRGIDIGFVDGRRLCIRDAWWRKNLDVWTGYQMWLENAEGIELRSWRPNKRRSEVVQAVCDVLDVKQEAQR